MPNERKKISSVAGVSSHPSLEPPIDLHLGLKTKICVDIGGTGDVSSAPAGQRQSACKVWSLVICVYEGTNTQYAVEFINPRISGLGDSSEVPVST